MNRSRLRPLLFALFAFSTSVCAVLAQTPSPTVIPFQGRLTNQQNVPYAEGKYTLTFNLYNEAVGGTTVWTERHEQVGVINGTVNVFLGSIQAITTVDFSTIKHLGITIDADANPLTADPEMVPRQMIIPAFWAKNAEKLAGQDWSAILVAGPTANDPVNGRIRGDKIALQGIQTAQIADSTITTAKVADGTLTSADLSAELKQASLVPPGSIIPFAGPTANIPSGWKLCDGSALRSTDFPTLYAAIGTSWGNGTTSSTGALNSFQGGVTNFNLPDLRGQFLRGVDGVAGRDPDASSRTAAAAGGNPGNAAGSIQSDQLKSHSHDLRVGYAQGPDRNQWALFYQGTTSVPEGGSIKATGGNETRPTNAYIHYIIKI